MYNFVKIFCINVIFIALSLILSGCVDRNKGKSIQYDKIEKRVPKDNQVMLEKQKIAKFSSEDNFIYYHKGRVDDHIDYNTEHNTDNAVVKEKKGEKSEQNYDYVKENKKKEERSFFARLFGINSSSDDDKKLNNVNLDKDAKKTSSGDEKEFAKEKDVSSPEMLDSILGEINKDIELNSDAKTKNDKVTNLGEQNKQDTKDSPIFINNDPEKQNEELFTYKNDKETLKKMRDDIISKEGVKKNTENEKINKTNDKKNAIIDSKSDIFVQVGAYSNATNVKNVIDELSKYGTINMSKVKRNNKTLHIIKLGPLKTIDEGKNLQAVLKKNGYKDSVLIKE